MDNSYVVEESATIGGSAEAVYAILADYHLGHPSVLPKPYFSALTVESGGRGAGTVIAVDMNVLGAKRTYKMKVTEPQPGRVLREEDPEAGVVTTFTVTPADEPTRSQVTIRTQTRTSPGLAGYLEKWVASAMTRKIYRQELKLLDQVVQQRNTA